MAKLRGITKSMLIGNDDLRKYERETSETTKYRDAYKLMSAHNDIMYCFYWCDGEDSMMSFPIERNGIEHQVDVEKNNIVICATNKEDIKFAGCLFEKGCIDKVVHNKKYGFIVVHYYNKYRGKKDRVDFALWGNNDVRFDKALGRFLVVLN